MRHRPNPSGAAGLSRAAVRGSSETRLSGPVATLYVTFRRVQPYPRGLITANQGSVAEEHRPCHRRTPDRWELCSNRAVLEMANGLRGRQDSS